MSSSTAAAGEPPGSRDLSTPNPAAARGDQIHASARVGEADLPALAPRDTLHPRRRLVLSHVRYARVSMGTGLKQRADSLFLDRESLPTCLTMESRPPQTIQRLGPLVSCMTNPWLHQEDTLAAVPWLTRDDSAVRTWSALSLQAWFMGRLSRAPAHQQDL